MHQHSIPQPFDYSGSSIDPASRPRGMAHAPYAAANPVTHIPTQLHSAGRLPAPQLPLHPPAHTPAWGSGGYHPEFPIPTVHAVPPPLTIQRTAELSMQGHPPGFPTPAVHAAPPPPTMPQRMATVPMPGHPLAFTATVPMTSELVNQGATPHHNLYAAQSIPHARGSLIGNRVGDDRGHEQGSWGRDHPGSDALRSPLDRPISGRTRRVLGRLLRPGRNATEPQPAEEVRCRYRGCGSLASREERLDGFCSDDHLWAARRCPKCGERLCPPGREVCSDTCGRG